MTGIIMGQTDSFVDPDGKEFDRQTIWYKVTIGTFGIDIEIHRQEPGTAFETRFAAMAMVNIDFFRGQVKAFLYDEKTPLDYDVDPIVLVENVAEWQPIPEGQDGEEQKECN